MRRSHAFLLGLAALTCYVNADVASYTGAASFASANSYSQANSDASAVDGVVKGLHFQNQKTSAFSASGASQNQHSSFSSGSYSEYLPPIVVSEANANNNVEAQGVIKGNAISGSQSLGFGAVPAPGPIKVQSPGNVQYWWMSEGSPFKTQGGCNPSGCSAHASFSGNNVAAESVAGSSVGSSGAAVSAGNPFLNQASKGGSQLGFGTGLGSQSGVSSQAGLGGQAGLGSQAGFNNQAGFGSQVGFGSQTGFGGQSGVGGNLGGQLGGGSYQQAGAHAGTSANVGAGTTGFGGLTSQGGLGGNFGVNSQSGLSGQAGGSSGFITGNQIGSGLGFGQGTSGGISGGINGASGASSSSGASVHGGNAGNLGGQLGGQFGGQADGLGGSHSVNQQGYFTHGTQSGISSQGSTQGGLNSGAAAGVSGQAGFHHGIHGGIHGGSTHGGQSGSQGGVGGQGGVGAGAQGGIHHNLGGGIHGHLGGHHAGLGGIHGGASSGSSSGIGAQGGSHVGGHHGGHLGGHGSHGIVSSTTQNPIGGGYPISTKPNPPFETGYFPCNGVGKVCVGKSQCINGYVTLPGVSLSNQQNQQCNRASEVCCTLKKEQPTTPAPGGDLHPGENNGYLPPINPSGSVERPNYLKPPTESDKYNAGSSNQAVGILPPNEQPSNQKVYQLGCAAALKCVEEQFCTQLGTISPTPVSLTPEQQLRRVPIVDCKEPDTGILGKCCRDPNYVDPWPAGNLPANYSGGFDEQGFPKFLNLSKPKKPIQSNPIQLGQPLRPFPSSNFPVQSFESQPTQPSFVRQPPTPGRPQPTTFERQPLPPTQPPKNLQPFSEVPEQNLEIAIGGPGQDILRLPKPPQEVPPSFVQIPTIPESSQTHGVILPTSTFRKPELVQPERPVANQPEKLVPYPGFVKEVPQSPKPFPSIEQPRPFQHQQTQYQSTPRPTPSFPTPQPPPFKAPAFPNQIPINTFGKVHETAPSNQNAVAIPLHKPGAQCGIINDVPSPLRASDVDVGFGAIPWQAMVLSNTEKKLLCSGAVVAPNVVLTAAHCVYGLVPSTVSVKVGEWKLGYELKHEEPLPFEIVQVQSIAAHPNYQHGAAGYDTALLYLEKSVHLDLHVDTICVPKGVPSVSPQRKCVSVGWGKVILETHAAGALMHKIDVDVLSKQQCVERTKAAAESIDLDDSLVCVKAHKQNNNMCQVDVGGPLACDRGDGIYELVGVYSQDTGCLPTNQVATFALVDNDWVNGMISSGPGLVQQPQQPESLVAPIQKQQFESGRTHYHQPGVPCDCQQGTLPAGTNGYLPPY